MSYAYRRRKKEIKKHKHFLDTNRIEPKAFAYIRAKWHSAVIGPPIGTLEDLMGAKT